MKAAVLNEQPGELVIEDLSIDKPAADEVLIQVVGAGLCHSDLHFMEGLFRTQLPIVMGHESAGIVQAVGDNVDYVKPGDHVVACLSIFCGQCHQCLGGHPNRCSNPKATSRGKGQAPRLSRADGTPGRSDGPARRVRRGDAGAPERVGEGDRGHAPRQGLPDRMRHHHRVRGRRAHGQGRGRLHGVRDRGRWYRSGRRPGSSHRRGQQGDRGRRVPLQAGDGRPTRRHPLRQRGRERRCGGRGEGSVWAVGSTTRSRPSARPRPCARPSTCWPSAAPPP